MTVTDTLTTNRPTIGELTKLLEAAIDRAEKYIEQVEAKGDLLETLKAFFHLKDSYDELEEQRKRLYALKDKMDKGTVPELIDNSGFDKVQVPELARSFYTLDKYSASIINKEKGYEWLRSNDASELITETVNAQTLAGFFKDMVTEKNIEPPEDLFKFTRYRITGISKYKPK